jgi:hypothetical protein
MAFQFGFGSGDGDGDAGHNSEDTADVGTAAQDECTPLRPVQEHTLMDLVGMHFCFCTSLFAQFLWMCNCWWDRGQTSGCETPTSTPKAEKEGGGLTLH